MNTTKTCSDNLENKNIKAWEAPRIEDLNANQTNGKYVRTIGEGATAGGWTYAES